jgi:hypothetical protein
MSAITTVVALMAFSLPRYASYSSSHLKKGLLSIPLGHSYVPIVFATPIPYLPYDVTPSNCKAEEEEPKNTREHRGSIRRQLASQQRLALGAQQKPASSCPRVHDEIVEDNYPMRRPPLALHVRNVQRLSPRSRNRQSLKSKSPPAFQVGFAKAST